MEVVRAALREFEQNGTGAFLATLQEVLGRLTEAVADNADPGTVQQCIAKVRLAPHTLPQNEYSDVCTHIAQSCLGMPETFAGHSQPAASVTASR